MNIIINLGLTALIPASAYAVALCLGVNNKWQRLIVALAALAYPAVIARSTLTTDESFGFLFPIILALIMLISANAKPGVKANAKAEVKHPVIKPLLSVLLGVVIVAGVFVNKSMLAVAVAMILTILFARIFYKKKIVCTLEFLIPVTLLGVAVFLSDGGAASLTDFVARPNFPRGFDSVDLIRLITGQLYYFAVSTWGLGILGFFLFIKALANTKAKEVPKPEKPVRISLFLMFAFLSVFFNLAISVIERLRFNLYESQEALMYGKYIDSVCPLLLVAVICCIFVYENNSLPLLDLRTILFAVVLMGAIFTAFFAWTAEIIVNADNVTISEIPGLYPLRIGVGTGSLITLETLFLSVSAVYSLMALFIVFISCARRYRRYIISGTIAAIALYSCIYTIAVFVPYGV
ncbi:MAG: hypothetical protein FWH07_01430 [Oscillospiraceae bacterium]|nr:hypothetical protein [Oscillospiraceae bacterium]